MAISYRQRGKKKLWDYRVFDNYKKVIASNSGFRTKKEAEMEALSVEIKLKKGAIVDKSVTLYQLWLKWFELQVKPLNKSESTMNKHYLRGRFIENYFKNKAVNAIKASDYQEFINVYAKTNSRDNVRRLNGEIKKVLIFAKRDRLSVEDFTEGVILSGRPALKQKKDRYIHHLKDYRRLVDYLESHFNYRESVIPYQLYVQLKTGFRAGEISGLTWDCVCWETQEIKTYRRYDTVMGCWTKPKTEESIRRVPVDRKVMRVLSDLYDVQKDYLSLYSIRNDDNAIFFDLFYGICTNNGINKHLRSILEKLDISPKNMSSTGLRHSYCSLLLASGIDIWAVAKLMGHKDIKQITETYGHLIAEKAEAENAKVRTLLGSLK
ncbi:tyrosine-type recombinase/integrase [Streptococcus sp. H49]|uniref:tyrosine-type recombinase/integrase n=1 Tax=Streptococcus huangxiaojuni TaxID=3237239 RepID=UPI0034A4697B